MYEIFKTIIESIVDPDGKPFAFYHGPKELQNAQKGIKTGFIYLDAPLESNAPFNVNGLLLDEFALSFLIAYPADMKWTYDKHAPLIEKARIGGDTLVTALNTKKRPTDGLNYFASLRGPIKKIDCVNIFDMNITGIYLQLFATPRKTIQKLC